MRFRTRVVTALRRSPLEKPTDWLLLHVAPGARERRHHHEIDLETVRFMEAQLEDGDAAIDVGAHTGAILRHIVRISPSAHHHAVEPLPDLAAALRDEYPNALVHECILGSAGFVEETKGRSTINRNLDDPGYSSVTREDHPRLKASRVEVVPVDVRTLDDIAGQVNRLRLVKIDVEGFEVEVLRGAPTMLREQAPVLVLEHERVAEGAAESRDLFELLDSSGYSICRLVDWRTHSPLTLDQFEASNAAGDSYYVAFPTNRPLTAS